MDCEKYSSLSSPSSVFFCSTAFFDRPNHDELFSEMVRVRRAGYVLNEFNKRVAAVLRNIT